MIVQAKIKLFIPCVGCTEGGWEAGHLNVGFETAWTCQNCGNESSITRIGEDEFRVILTGRKQTPVVVTLQSVSEPKITLKLNTWKYAHSQGDSQEEYESHQRYFYDEHTCPTNWIRDVVEIIYNGDRDPHGVFEFVSVEDGHLVDSPFYDGMVLSPDGKELQ